MILSSAFATMAASSRDRSTTLHNLVEVESNGGHQPRVVPFGPTLGYDAESRWDSRPHMNTYDFSKLHFRTQHRDIHRARVIFLKRITQNCRSFRFAVD